MYKVSFIISDASLSHLLFGDVYRLVKYDPRDSFVTGRHGRRPVVSHVVLGVR